MTSQDLLRYPIDQYQRYQDIRQVVTVLSANKPLRILDVGGTTVTTQFLPNEHHIVTINPVRAVNAAVVGSGMQLPFGDGTFDVVISVDTLEHIPYVQRQQFIDELMRLTRAFSVLTAPFASGYNETAEQILNNFFASVLQFEHPSLTEHLENGLPDLDSCLGWIAAHTPHIITIPSGYIHHWLPLMMIHHAMDQLRDGESLQEDLHRLYNYQAYWRDHQPPSYRQVIVASKHAPQNLFDQLQTLFQPPPAAPDLNGVIGLWQALRWQQTIARKDAEFRALMDHKDTEVQAITVTKNAKIDALNTEIEHLRELVTGYESGRVMRFFNWLEHLKQRVWPTL